MLNSTSQDASTLHLHGLRVPDRITFKLTMLIFQFINGTAPGYLSSDMRRMADVPGRKCSAASSLPAIHATRRSIGDRTFVIAVTSVSNKLPQDLRSTT